VPSIWSANVDNGRITALEDKNVRTTRFATIGSGTSGTVTLPANSTVVLDDFGGTVDAVVAGSLGGRPTVVSVVTSGGVPVATTFDSAGNYVFSAAPSSYPVSIVYRVQQTLVNFDSSASNIWGVPSYDGISGIGDPVARGVANRVLFTGASGELSQDVGFIYNSVNDSLQVPLIISTDGFSAGGSLRAATGRSYTQEDIVVMTWGNDQVIIRDGTPAAFYWSNTDINNDRLELRTIGGAELDFRAKSVSASLLIASGLPADNIALVGPGGVLGTDSIFAWNNTNKILGVGVAPAANQRVAIKGLGTTSATNSLRVQNSAAADLLTLRDDGALFLNSGATICLRISGAGNTSASATAGAVALPANTVGFLVVTIDGTTRKIPYYAT